MNHTWCGEIRFEGIPIRKSTSLVATRETIGDLHEGQLVPRTPE
jgi:hypothetical protein